MTGAATGGHMHVDCCRKPAIPGPALHSVSTNAMLACCSVCCSAEERNTNRGREGVVPGSSDRCRKEDAVCDFCFFFLFFLLFLFGFVLGGRSQSGQYETRRAECLGAIQLISGGLGSDTGGLSSRNTTRSGGRAVVEYECTALLDSVAEDVGNCNVMAAKGSAAV